MKNAQKIKTIFIGINVILFSLVSCDNSTEKIDSGKPAKLNTDFSERAEYHIVKPQELDPERIDIDSLYVQIAYQISTDRLIIIGKSENDDPQGLRMLLVNPKKNYKLIYRSRGAWDSWTMHPTFFNSNIKGSSTVILVAHGTSESWGQQVFLMKGDIVKEIGFIDVTHKEQADTSFYEDGFRLTDIGPLTKIRTKGGLLNFSFQADSILYYGTIGDQYDITFSGDKLEYNYDGDSLKVVVKDLRGF